MVTRAMKFKRETIKVIIIISKKLEYYHRTNFHRYCKSKNPLLNTIIVQALFKLLHARKVLPHNKFNSDNKIRSLTH